MQLFRLAWPALLCVAIALVVGGVFGTGWAWLFAVAGGLVLSWGLKHLFSRPRPDLVPHGSVVYTASFPSGHSMMSAVTYLTLGALLARVQTRKRLKAYLLSVAIVASTSGCTSRPTCSWDGPSVRSGRSSAGS